MRKSKPKSTENSLHHAEYYDLAYQAGGKSYIDESNLLHEFIESNKNTEGKALLDIGCGTGSHLPFLEEWYSVEGLDIDPEMLRIAREKHPEHTFYEGDMVDFTLDSKYDVITCLFSAIGYAKSKSKLDSAIRSFESHLKPGGVIIVEPWFYPDQWELGRPSAVFIDDTDMKFARMNIAERRDDISVLKFHFLVATNDGVEYFTEFHELGLFTHEEYMTAFTAAGLEVIHDKSGIIGRGLYIGRKKPA